MDARPHRVGASPMTTCRGGTLKRGRNGALRGAERGGLGSPPLPALGAHRPWKPPTRGKTVFPLCSEACTAAPVAYSTGRVVSRQQRGQALAQSIYVSSLAATAALWRSQPASPIMGAVTARSQ